MKEKINNLLEALAPLSTKKLDMGEIMIMAFLQSQWQLNQQVQVSDVLKNVQHLSYASVNRKLKNLKKSKILFFQAHSSDARIKIIIKGDKFVDYINALDSLINKHEKNILQRT
jgi:hypothetical protein